MAISTLESGQRATSDADLAGQRVALMRWYAAHGRHELPWRLTREPYAVLVSEVMLQQTPVERVVPYYQRWLSRWPDWESLSAASPSDVIREWAGLGYNRRALGLLRTALQVVSQCDGALPSTVGALRRLPGVGPYTAGAIACFAFEQDVAVVDTNIGRVLARAVLGIDSAKSGGARDVRETAARFFPPAGAREHNLALMDLGALLCVARQPVCEQCPLEAMCAWRLAGEPLAGRRTATAVRFEDTARYARGRLIAALREGERTFHALEAALPAAHRPSARDYLCRLEREGMVEQVGEGVWRLPSRLQGSSSMASPKL